MSNVSLPVGRLFPIETKFFEVYRLWTTGSIHDVPADDDQIIGELNSIIADLQTVVSELQRPKGDWLDD